MREMRLQDGRMILLREMTKRDMLPGGNGRCPVNCKMVIGGTLAPSDNFRILNQEMIEKYGTTAILAIDQDAIVGFVNFYPTLKGLARRRSATCNPVLNKPPE